MTKETIIPGKGEQPKMDTDFPRVPRQVSQGHTYSNKPSEVRISEKCVECKHLTLVNVGLFDRKKCMTFNSWIVSRFKSKALGQYIIYKKKPDCQRFEKAE